MRHYGACIPNNMASGKAFEDLDLSKDEVKRLGDALKDEKFRKMLAEYAEEISDPENRRKAEEEIAMMENERGMNVQFIHPKPGHVLKTTVDGSTKAFINICQNDKVDKPVAKREKDGSGKSGLMWQIPHSFAPPRDDVDKSNGKCKIFDVVFHPDTYRMASNNERFRKLVEDTAIEGIEKQFNVTLDKKNIRHVKCKFKGQPVATVIRERIPDKDVTPVDPESILGQMPYPYDNKTSAEKNKTKTNVESKKASNKDKTLNENKPTEPSYTITHRSDLDMSEYRNAPDAKVSTRPKELVIKINLPLLKSAADASLDIFEKKLILESVSPAAYKLDLNLPFPVNEDEGSAKFDKSRRTLTITVPVIPEKVPKIPFSHRGEGDASNDKNEEGSGNDLITLLSDTVIQNGKEANSEPLIEELNGNDKHETQTYGKDKMKLPDNVKWLLPESEISQDNETISLVLKVQCVEEGSVNLTFPEKRNALIQFMSIGAGCFPSYYSLNIEFCEGCLLSADHCNVDISDDNLVLLLLKAKDCRGLWDFYSIGVDKDSLEIKQFLTESNLKRELSALDEAAEKEAGMPVQEENIPEVSVTEMSSEKLTMQIKPRNKKKEKKSAKQHAAKDEEDDEYDDYDPPSSAEIEVVHRQPTPNLHSILKQRTVSESSEDHSLTAELESPRSCEEDELSSSFNKRRSVSFNSHVDRASFKASASVSSMAPALKSKRKRQRKRDERIQRGRRNRHNSGGDGTSGTSSGEDMRHRESFSDSHSLSEEDGEDVDLRKVVLMRANSDPGPGAQDGKSPEGEKKKTLEEVKGKEKDDGEENHAVRDKVITDSSECLDFRTKSIDGEILDQDKSEGCENISESKIARKQNLDVRQEKNKKMVEEIKGKLEATKISDGNKNDVKECGRDSDDDDDVDNKGSENMGKREADATKKVSGDGDEEEEPKEKNEVNSMLSWDDRTMNGDEHRTQCAFTFSNNLMFDLDVD